MPIIIIKFNPDKNISEAKLIKQLIDSNEIELITFGPHKRKLTILKGFTDEDTTKALLELSQESSTLDVVRKTD